MATIQIRVGDKEPVEQVEAQKPDGLPLKIKINARKTLDGNIMIYDHPDIYIVIIPSKNKVLTMVKDEFGDHVYEAQNALMKYLTKKGVILPDTIHSGNIYSSLEAKYPESARGINADKMVLFMIAKWLEEEKPYLAWEEAFEDAQDDALLNPDAEHSTELGEVPHKEKKGSVNAYTTMGRYMYGI